MSYCDQCGSTSFDMQGFCRGCGAHAMPPSQQQLSSPSPIASALNPLPVIPASSPSRYWRLGLVQPEVKNPWVAALLALLLGPLGMTYCTYLGAVVMFFAEIVAFIYLPKIVSMVAVPVAGAVWAWFAARSANSIY